MCEGMSKESPRESHRELFEKFCVTKYISHLNSNGGEGVEDKRCFEWSRKD